MFEDKLNRAFQESHAAGKDAYERIGDESLRYPNDFNFYGAQRDLNRNVALSNQQMAAQAGGNPLLARQARYAGGENAAMAGGLGRQLGYQGDMATVGLDSDILGERLRSMREQQLGLNRRGIASIGAPLAGAVGDIAGEGAADAWAWGQVLGMFG
jgi:hypothetical protein